MKTIESLLIWEGILDAVGGQEEEGYSPNYLVHHIHRTALGLDPRATLNTARAYNGPRINSEDGTERGVGYAPKLMSR